MGLNPCNGRFWRVPRPAVLTALLAAGCALQGSDTPTLVVPGPESAEPTVEAHNLAGLADFAQGQPRAEQWQRVLAVYVVPDGDLDDPPAVLGSYEALGEVLRFVPRYGLAPGLTYRARLDTSALAAGSAGVEPLEVEFSIARLVVEPTAMVDRVYPSRNVLPENLLRFYIHFSSPMGRGQAYDRIRLLDGSGSEVEMAFLELGEELWDPRGMRFTILFDPGRIKRGLVPREEEGPVLVQGNTYTLLVDSGFLDATGLPMVEEFRKTFRVVEPVMTRVDPAAWTIDPPRAGSRQPLVLRLSRSMDHALLGRMIWVVDARGLEIAGAVVVQDEETRWAFMPDADWKAGAHELVMDTTMEDVSGNTIQGPFDFDVFGTGATRIEAETVSLGFTVSR